MKSKYLLLGLVFLSSCSQEQIVAPEEGTQQEENLQGDQYLLKITPFNMVIGGQTSRTMPTISDKRTSYQWVAGDTIGIFPFKKGPDAQTYTQKGDQVWFAVTPKENANSATFDGGGWQIKKDMNYIAYYPFIDKFRMDPKAMEVSFAGQGVHAKNDYSNFGKYDYMVAAPQQQATVDGGMSFQFKHVSALCVLKFRAKSSSLEGWLKSIVFAFPENDKLFCETATLDLTKCPQALIPKTTTATISIDLQKYQYRDGEYLEIPFLMGPTTDLAGKTCNVTLVKEPVGGGIDGYTVTEHTTLTFTSDLKSGNGYFLHLYFPDIDPDKNCIRVYDPGSLTMERIQKAMNGSGKLVVDGLLNAEDFDVLQEAAGAGAQATSRAAGATVLTDLDLLNVMLDESMVKADGTVDFPSFAGSKLTRLVMPHQNNNVNLLANTFSGVPLQYFEFSYIGKFYKGTIDQAAFDGCETANCDLLIGKTFFEYLSADAKGDLLFTGKKFKSYKEAIYDWESDQVINKPLNAVTVDAQSHTLTIVVAGGMKETDVTAALASGTELKVTGKLSDRDLKAVAAYKTASITSLTFDTLGEYVPTADVFAGCTYSANCDLVIPDAWKSKVSAGADGKVMFGGVAWKSIKSVETGLGFEGLQPYEPGLNF